MLQCVAVCYSVCCSALQCVAASGNRNERVKTEWWQPTFSKKSQCIAVFCSVLQCVAVCHSVLQCVAVCCSVLQCVRKERKDED